MGSSAIVHFGPSNNIGQPTSTSSPTSLLEAGGSWRPSHGAPGPVAAIPALSLWIRGRPSSLLPPLMNPSAPISSPSLSLDKIARVAAMAIVVVAATGLPAAGARVQEDLRHRLLRHVHRFELGPLQASPSSSSLPWTSPSRRRFASPTPLQPPRALHRPPPNVGAQEPDATADACYYVETAGDQE
ncbi:uncharacterized protein [Triticum aestivum]|uniref:uncharacterized protein n=1 Tax=Triticum aestivum TaxID=4565 RepID=UPI001D0173E6|nr:uncharacterized protein LOC123168662 [Triticum aestivum]